MIFHYNRLLEIFVKYFVHFFLALFHRSLVPWSNLLLSVDCLYIYKINRFFHPFLPFNSNVFVLKLNSLKKKLVFSTPSYIFSIALIILAYLWVFVSREISKFDLSTTYGVLILTDTIEWYYYGYWKSWKN